MTVLFKPLFVKTFIKQKKIKLLKSKQDFVQYQKFLDNQWRQLEQRIQDDEDFQKAGKAKIQISEEFFFTLDIKGLSGLMITINNMKKIDKNNILTYQALITNSVSTTRSNNEIPTTFEDIFIKVDSYDVFYNSDYLRSEISTVEASITTSGKAPV